MSSPLKLMAETKDDLLILSSLMQDATLMVADMIWQKDKHSFTAVLNRFRWEEHQKNRWLPWNWFSTPKRVRSGLHVKDVIAARYRNIPFTQQDHILSLLAVNVDLQEDGMATLTFQFSGYASLQLDVECINILFEDITEDWDATATPTHQLGDFGELPE